MRAAYWFNPLIWIACRRLRDESEQACDDTVLRRGIDAADYASHLLAVARQVLTADRGWASAPAVANASTLERRIAAMLNASRNREPLTRPAGVVSLLAMLAVTIPVTSLTLTERVAAAAIAPAVLRDVALVPEPAVPAQAPPAVAARPVRRAAAPREAAAPAQQQPATFSGVVSDATGAVMPGVLVTLTNSASGMAYSAVSAPNGAFVVRNLPPSGYQFRAELPGFTTLTEVVTLAAGEDCSAGSRCVSVGSRKPSMSRVRLRPLSVLDPARRLSHSKSPCGDAIVRAAGGPLRVGGQIGTPAARKVAPGCPGNLPANGYVVILEGTIGVDGLVKDIKICVPGQATNWTRSRSPRSTPFVSGSYATRLNNVPVPVIVTVVVSYVRQ